MPSYREMTAQVNLALARAHNYKPAASDNPGKDILNHMDILIVAQRLPHGERPSSQMERFSELARIGHKF